MLLRVLHLFSKDTLERRQLAVRLLQFDEPCLAVRHTGYTVCDADLCNAAKLVRKAAQRLHAFAEIPLYFFFCHAVELDT